MTCLHEQEGLTTWMHQAQHMDWSHLMLLGPGQVVFQTGFVTLSANCHTSRSSSLLM